MRRIIQIAYAVLIATLIGSVAYAQNPQLQLNQGSVTAGQQGNLTLGAVSPTTSTFATGTTMPFQLDTMGNLKVNVASGLSVSIGTVALATGANIVGYTSADPCAQSAKLATPLTGGNAAGVTQQLVATGATGKKVYVCAIHIIVNAPVNFSLWEGTASGCSTGTAALMGSIAATAGEAIATQGGFTLGSGSGTVAETATTGDGVCVIVTPAAQFGGNITYVQQ